MNPRFVNAALCGGICLIVCTAVLVAAGAGVDAVLAGLAAGLVAASGGWLAARHTAAPIENGRLQDAIAANSQLRHDLRGALSPALLVSDRLTGHGDPAVVKAGNTVVRAVQRATELLESNKVADSGRMTPR